MSHKAVMQFLEATSNDASLQEQLSKLIGVGDGDISSAKELDGEEAQALLGERGVAVTAFAEKQGYVFSLSELNVVISVFQRYQTGELSEADFAKAMGLPDTNEGGLKSAGKTIGMVYRGVKYSVTQDKSSPHQVLDFMKKTSEDAEFRDQLKDILAVGDGDIGNFSELDTDEISALRSGRGALVAEFAAKHGFVFTLSDLLAVTDAFERVQSGELDNDEFEKFLSLEVNSRDFFPFIENVASMTYKGVKYSHPVASKAQSNTLPVIRFMERSGSDPALQKQLMALIGGDGDISAPGELDSQEASTLGGDLGNQIVKLGAENGFRFTVADLSAVTGAFQLVNSGELPIESCSRILGLGKAEEVSNVAKKTAGLIYRGVRH